MPFPTPAGICTLKQKPQFLTGCSGEKRVFFWSRFSRKKKKCRDFEPRSAQNRDISSFLEKIKGTKIKRDFPRCSPSKTTVFVSSVQMPAGVGKAKTRSKNKTSIFLREMFGESRRRKTLKRVETSSMDEN